MIKIFRDGIQKLFRSGNVGAHLHALSSPAHNGATTAAFLAQGASYHGGTGINTWTTDADLLYAVPFVSPARGGLLNMVSCPIASTGGDLRLGIYSNKDDHRNVYPDALLWGSEAIPVVTADHAALSNIQLDPNRIYWAVLLTEQARTGAYDSSNYGASHLLGMAEAATTVIPRSITASHAFAALPDPFPAGGAFATPHPVLKLRYL